MTIRVGAGGGIGCPEAALSAFGMGAAYIVTGTINQLSRQSGTSDFVRRALSVAGFSDVSMAPAADMFEQGAQVQVLKSKETMFALRAKKLAKIFAEYNSLEEIPKTELERLETTIDRKSVV